MKVLLVDDNATFLNALESLLLQYPQCKQVVKMRSGVELLNYNNLQDVDLILMDIDMPGLNGFETAIRFDFMHRHIMKIAISMYDDRAYLDKLVSSGFRGYVSKTRVAEELFGVIARVMKGELVFPSDILCQVHRSTKLSQRIDDNINQ